MVAEGKLSASISSSFKKAFTYNTQTNVEKESKTKKKTGCFVLRNRHFGSSSSHKQDSPVTAFLGLRNFDSSPKVGR